MVRPCPYLAANVSGGAGAWGVNVHHPCVDHMLTKTIHMISVLWFCCGCKTDYRGYRIDYTGYINTEAEALLISLARRS